MTYSLRIEILKLFFNDDFRQFEYRFFSISFISNIKQSKISVANKKRSHFSFWQIEEKELKCNIKFIQRTH